METSFLLWLVAVSFLASASGGMMGMASGVFIVPILTTFGHIPIHTAIGASLISVIACSCGSAAPSLNKRLTNVRLALVLETATTLGAVLGVLLAGRIPVAALYLLFALILLLSARSIVSRRAEFHGEAPVNDTWGWAKALALDGSYPDPISGREISYQVQRLPLGLLLMGGAGLISALLGIGSGVLKIPAMDTALRLPIKVSSATSNFMIGVTAAAGAGAYFARGYVSPAIAGPVALGSVVGAALGVRLMVRIPSEKIRLLLTAVLVLLAAQMLFQAFESR